MAANQEVWKSVKIQSTQFIIKHCVNKINRNPFDIPNYCDRSADPTQASACSIKAYPTHEMKKP